MVAKIHPFPFPNDDRSLPSGPSTHHGRHRTLSTVSFGGSRFFRAARSSEEVSQTTFFHGGVHLVWPLPMLHALFAIKTLAHSLKTNCS